MSVAPNFSIVTLGVADLGRSIDFSTRLSSPSPTRWRGALQDYDAA